MNDPLEWQEKQKEKKHHVVFVALYVLLISATSTQLPSPLAIFNMCCMAILLGMSLYRLVSI